MWMRMEACRWMGIMGTITMLVVIMMTTKAAMTMTVESQPRTVQVLSRYNINDQCLKHLHSKGDIKRTIALGTWHLFTRPGAMTMADGGEYRLQNKPLHMHLLPTFNITLNFLVPKICCLHPALRSASPCGKSW